MHRGCVFPLSFAFEDLFKENQPLLVLVPNLRHVCSRRKLHVTSTVNPFAALDTTTFEFSPLFKGASSIDSVLSSVRRSRSVSFN